MTSINSREQFAAAFTEYVESSSFPCVGARSAFNRNRVRFGLYQALGNGHEVATLCADLNAFSLEFPNPLNEPVTFIAMFKQAVVSPEAFDLQMWQHLQAMHDYDSQHFAWDNSVSANPEHANFSFSVGGRAYFLVGLSPVSPRLARRAPMPCIVFNFHNQFESLRASGEYDKLQKGIRKLDMALQGSINPMLAKFGQDSEARQYSGLAYAQGWQCPFQQRKKQMQNNNQGLVRIPPQSGKSFKLERGETLRVFDPCGEQVADLFAFQDGNSANSLSSGRSIDYAGNIYLSTGDVLYSNNSLPMFTIMADSAGRHDFLLTPCSQEMFEILYQHHGHHPSCFENLCMAFAEYDISPAQISTTFNIFMNAEVAHDGTISVKTPSSKAGDYIDLKAEMDMICALTSCSAEKSNNGTFKPIDYAITPAMNKPLIMD